MYRLGIFTSLYDDYVTELLKKLDEGINEGTLQAEVSFVLCNVREGLSTAIDRRIKKIKKLKNLKNLIFFPSKEFEPHLRRESLQEWRIKHDRVLMRLLPGKADSYLALGYMQIIGAEMLEAMEIVNIHPAIPKIGPIGMWPKVMEEQAERPLPYLLNLTDEELKERIPLVMNISHHKAGGMLHLATEETDRGPVIAWYEFALTSRKLDELWIEVVSESRKKPLKDVKRGSAWEELKAQIRHEQFKGEEPLLLITYKNLTQGLWKIQDKRLYIKDVAHQEGYCLNYEIKEYFEQRGIEGII